MAEDKINIFLDNLVSCYKTQRESHLKKYWRTTRSVFIRLIKNSNEYDNIRNIDIDNLKIAKRLIKKHIHNDNLTNDDIDDTVVFLNIHVSMLEERRLYLLLLPIVPLSFIFKDETVVQVIALLASILVVRELILAVERKAIYSELITILTHINKKQNADNG